MVYNVSPGSSSATVMPSTASAIIKMRANECKLQVFINRLQIDYVSLASVDTKAMVQETAHAPNNLKLEVMDEMARQ